MKKYMKHIQNKREGLIALLCLYNLSAFTWSIVPVTLDIARRQPFQWHFPLLTLVPLGMQLFSTVGLWYKKKWAFVVQIFFYLFQSILYKDDVTTYYYFLGPHFYLKLYLSLPDGTVVLGFNIVAITILILLGMASIHLKPFEKEPCASK